MRKIYLIFALLVGTIASNAQDHNFQALDQLFDDSLTLFNNNVYNVIFEDNKRVYKYQEGIIDSSNFRLGIASATKLISATIMLKLQEEGWFTLDDSIGTYLPVFTTYGKGHVTIRNAYSMSSGVLNEGHAGQEYHRNPNLTLDQSVDSIAKNLPLVFQPGTMMAYDGSMMHVVGKVVEVIDSINGNNRDWNTIAKEEFFDILGMDSTDYDKFLPNPAVAGGIKTTPLDYLILLKMLANKGFHEGSQFLSPQSVNNIFTLQYGDIPLYAGGTSVLPFEHPDYAHNLDTVRYSFGGWVMERDTVSGNPLVLASPGAYGTFPWIDKCRNMYGILFTYVPAGGANKIMNTYLKMMKIVREEVGGCNILSVIDSPDFKAANIKVYPNPVENYVYIKSEKKISRISIFNNVGSVVAHNSFEGDREIEIQLSGLSSGIYFLKVITNDNLIIGKKLVVQ